MERVAEYGGRVQCILANFGWGPTFWSWNFASKTMSLWTSLWESCEVGKLKKKKKLVKN